MTILIGGAPVLVCLPGLLNSLSFLLRRAIRFLSSFMLLFKSAWGGNAQGQKVDQIKLILGHVNGSKVSQAS